MPVLGFGWYGDDGAGSHGYGGLSPLLIPAAACHANQHLYLLVVNVPVVAAAGLKGDICHTVHFGKIALADEVLSVGVLNALRPDVEVNGRYSLAGFAEHACHSLLAAYGLSFADALTENGRNVVQLSIGNTHVTCSADVCLQLWLTAGQGRNSGYGDYFAVSEREVIAGKDVAEEVGLQVVVGLRGEGVVKRLAANEPCLYLRSLF